MGVRETGKDSKRKKAAEKNVAAINRKHVSGERERERICV